jgi:hypothetical protein
MFVWYVVETNSGLAIRARPYPAQPEPELGLGNACKGIFDLPDRLQGPSP